MDRVVVIMLIQNIKQQFIDSSYSMTRKYRKMLGTVERSFNLHCWIFVVQYNWCFVVCNLSLDEVHKWLWYDTAVIHEMKFSELNWIMDKWHQKLSDRQLCTSKVNDVTLPYVNFYNKMLFSCAIYSRCSMV